MNSSTEIEGLLQTPLKFIADERGAVMHGLRVDAAGYAGFGEAYFSFVRQGVTKGWKRHKRMTLNLVVPVGQVRFLIVDLRGSSGSNGKQVVVELGERNRFRLTVPPGLWVAFRGVDEGPNVLLNIASIAHDPAESDNVSWDDEEAQRLSGLFDFRSQMEV